MVYVLNEIPTDEDIELDLRLIRQFGKCPNDYLIKDLWNIVLSFFFGGTPHLLISVPLRAIVAAPLLVATEFAFLPPFDRYLSYFYGWEDGGDLDLILNRYNENRTEMTVSGHYPLAFCDHRKTMITFRNIRATDDMNRRCLLQMTFDPLQMPKPKHKWFAWDKEKSKLFHNYGDAYVFHVENNHIPMFETLGDGRIKKAFQFETESQFRVSRDGQFHHDCFLKIELPPR